MPCLWLSRMWLLVPSGWHFTNWRFPSCISIHPSPALGHLMWSLSLALWSIFRPFLGTSMMLCCGGQNILWSWGSRPIHLWGCLPDLIFVGRRRTLGKYSRGCWKWGGLEFFWIGLKRALTASSEYKTILWEFGGSYLDNLGHGLLVWWAQSCWERAKFLVCLKCTQLLI